jgi:hypothetical protein
LLAACDSELGLPKDPSPFVRFPIALHGEPSGRWLLAVGANFDRKYRAGSLRLIDTQASRFLAGDALEVPGFAGGLALTLAGDGTTATARAFVTARDDDSLTVVDLDPKAPKLACGTPTDEGQCNDGWRFAGKDLSNPDAPKPLLGEDPLGLAIGPAPDGKRFAHVVATTDGQVTVIHFDPSKPLGTSIGLQRVATLNLGAGLTGIATSTATGRVYVSDARAPRIYVYRVLATGDSKAPWRIEREPDLAIPSAGGRDFGRGLAVSHDGGRLYAAWRSPSALAVVDLAPDRAGAASPAIAAMVPLGPGAAEVAVARSGPGGREMAYVTSFHDDSVWVVDSELGTAVDAIKLRQAPHAIALVDVPPAAGHPGGWTLYATLFNAHAIVAVPLAGGVRDRNRLVAEVKTP